MKVLYDHQIFEHQRIGGVSRYFTEIIRHLPVNIDVEVSVQYTFNEYLKRLDIPFEWKDQLISYHSFLPSFNFKGKKRLYSFLQQRFPVKYPDFYKINQTKTIEKLKKGDFDIFHPTFFGDYYLDYLKGKPYVLTVHDMIIELYPEFINSPQFVKRKKKLVDNAAHIIAVSENTKRDIINVFGTSADKISVTYHASSLTNGGNKPQNLPAKYILYIGDRRLGYKNFSFFVSSIQPILQTNKDLYVVCTGDSFTPEENNYFESLGIKDQLKNIFVADSDLLGLYTSAEMFIYPSYYEGFGIPILEAFQAGCPVVLSNSSCFPEVAGDAGIYFDPKSPVQLRVAISTLLDNAKLKQDVVNKGRLRLQNYSWAKTAMQTADIYRNVLSKI